MLSSYGGFYGGLSGSIVGQPRIPDQPREGRGKKGLSFPLRCDGRATRGRGSHGDLGGAREGKKGAILRGDVDDDVGLLVR